AGSRRRGGRRGRGRRRFRGDFDWWFEQTGARAALRLVGLCYDGGDVVSLVKKSFEGRHGELGRAEENDPHHSGRAVSATTSLRYPASSLRSRRQRASSIWRLIRLR